ncbi:shikimate kinase [Siculibacillus lacustris]|uniref:Shikimate kinase n=1 Tax=Siculibacillus lacustris TaxID=1549641 RepID=A0A4Q9VW11_9HYPH|nr:shikimate kinase [Siculibacillus lacustris]
MGNDGKRTDVQRARRILAGLGVRSIVFVGMMGAGKTTVGRRVAARLDLPFADVDVEIERAAAQTIPEIFAEYGEAYFRDGERRVIGRLLGEGPQVLATGGGAFMNAETRAAIARCGVSVWIEAAPEVLFQRLRHKTNRPLLAGPDPEGAIRRLVEERYPVYALADLTVPSRDVSKDVVADEIVAALDRFFARPPAAVAAAPSAPPAGDCP